MTQATTKFLAAFAYVALIATLAAGGTQSAATPYDMASSEPSITAAEQLFADAPDGVDPMVTGPVTAAFRQRRDDAGCDRAVWPNIPMACYPQ